MTVVDVEEELLAKRSIRPEDVLEMPRAATRFLRAPKAEVIDIIRYTLRDMSTGRLISDIIKLPAISEHHDQKDDYLLVKYTVTPQFLKIRKMLGCVEFFVGAEAIASLRIVERLYFRDTLIRKMDTNLGECSPRTRDKRGFVYKMPSIPKSLARDMMASPFETRCDTFFFVNGELVVHNRSQYAFELSLN